MPEQHEEPDAGSQPGVSKISIGFKSYEVGKRYYKEAGLNLPVTYFDAPEGRSKADMGPIIDTIIQYDTVEVFYGRYTNLVHHFWSHQYFCQEFP